MYNNTAVYYMHYKRCPRAYQEFEMKCYGYSFSKIKIFMMNYYGYKKKNNDFAMCILLL